MSSPSTDAALPNPAEDPEDFGEEMDFDDELASILRAAESPSGAASAIPPGTHTGPDRAADSGGDIEDLVSPTPFGQFRERKGWLSVSDLVGTVWCEVQVSRSVLLR